MFGLTFCSRSSASVILSTAGIWSLAQARGASRRQGPVPHLHRGDKCTTPSLRHCTTIPPSCLQVPLFTTVHHHSNTMLLRTHCEDEEAEEWLELRWVWTARQCRACLFPLYDLLLALSVYLCWCSHFEVCRLWFGQRFELNSKKKKKKNWLSGLVFMAIENTFDSTSMTDSRWGLLGSELNAASFGNVMWL